MKNVSWHEIIKGLGGTGLVKLLRYYGTKALRGNRNVGGHYYADRKHTVGLVNPTYKKLKRSFAGAQNDMNASRHCKTYNEIDKEANTNYNSNIMNYKSENKTVSEAHSKHLVPYCLSNLVFSKKVAFTLAEILITLGIIGVVAALTIPTISRNIQQAVLKNQFKKFYSTFWQAVIGIQTKEGRPVKCYYWDGTNPYTGKCTPKCKEKNEFGSCIGGYVCEETDQTLPGDYNGPVSECSSFHEELFLKTLKTTKICKDKAYEQGCLPKDFRGTDVVNSEKNPDQEYDPAGYFADSPVKNNYPVFVLSDGTYIIEYYKYLSSMPQYVVDINGHKGPNKWGYDIFSFSLVGNSQVGINKLKSANYTTDKGGKFFDEMYDEVFNNN